MSKSVLIREADSQSHPPSTINQKIKPLKKVIITSAGYSGSYERQLNLIPVQATNYQIKNPKWASLFHDADCDWDYDMLKPLKKCKSLQLTSIIFDGRQIGATVGHFWGDIKHLDKVSRHLKKLHMGAGAAGKKRLGDLNKYLKRRKSLTDLLLVPYWFPLPNHIDADESDIEDYTDSVCQIDGISRMIHLLGGKLEKLGLFGYAREDLIKRLNMNLMKRLKHFTLKAAFRPKGSDGDSSPFDESYLGHIEKILKSENIKVLTLYAQCDVTDKEFWVSLKDLLVTVKRPFIVDVKVNYRYSCVNTNRWFKKMFKELPENIKVNYSVRDQEYFLSMPQRIEVLGVEDGASGFWSSKSDDDEDEDEDEDVQDHENEGQNDEEEAE